MCIIVAAVFLFKREPEPVLPSGDGTVNTNNFVVNEDNVEDVITQLDEAIERGRFMTHMNTTWSFDDSTSPSRDAVIGNHPSNHYAFWFDLAVEGEEVYTSSLLPVGAQVKTLTLNKPLEKGTYSAILSIHMIDENNEPVESNMSFSITLVIDN